MHYGVREGEIGKIIKTNCQNLCNTLLIKFEIVAIFVILSLPVLLDDYHVIFTRPVLEKAGILTAL